RSIDSLFLETMERATGAPPESESWCTSRPFSAIVFTFGELEINAKRAGDNLSFSLLREPCYRNSCGIPAHAPTPAPKSRSRSKSKMTHASLSIVTEESPQGRFASPFLEIAIANQEWWGKFPLRQGTIFHECEQSSRDH